jgi:hypothetical protein
MTIGDEISADHGEAQGDGFGAFGTPSAGAGARNASHDRSQSTLLPQKRRPVLGAAQKAVKIR